MTADPGDASAFLSPEKIEELASCCQGQIITFKQQAWIASGDLPTTVIAKAQARPGDITILSETAPHGLVILTQTCDIVPRPGRHRPFVTVAQVVVLEGQVAEEARKRWRPQYAHLPAFGDGSYFADLDRVTTVETGIILACQRVDGVVSDQEKSAFAEAVARKFARFAFPDDLPIALSKWKKSVIKKHDSTGSPEGTLYRHADEVRLGASPSWQAEEIDVTVNVIFPPGFLPITDPDVEPDVDSVGEVARLSPSDLAQRLNDGIDDASLGVVYCDQLQTQWSNRCIPHGVIRSVSFELVSTDEMTVDVYRDTYSFDLEFLSAAESGKRS